MQTAWLDAAQTSADLASESRDNQLCMMLWQGTFPQKTRMMFSTPQKTRMMTGLHSDHPSFVVSLHIPKKTRIGSSCPPCAALLPASMPFACVITK
jgi:hypothetical protein